MEGSETRQNENDFLDFAPREEWSLLSQGAEAKVWKLAGINGSVQFICKERFSKAYRHPHLDERLTKSRCRSEARILEKCTKKSDLRVPKVIRVSPPLLYMEYFNGPSLKAYLKEEKDSGFLYEKLATKMGEMIGKLHNLGVIHGDLTTSNMIVLPSDRVEMGDQRQDVDLVLIDFGLSKSSSSVEEQAVDLYVLERALESTHPNLPENFWGLILKNYATIANKPSEKKHQQSTLQRLEQVRQRGRKRECFG